MPIELDDYEKVADMNGITKYERTVRTPGYDGDEAIARKVVYEAHGRRWVVHRISTLGWSVTEYGEDGRPNRRSSSFNLSYFDSEAEAHECAKQWVNEYASE